MEGCTQLEVLLLPPSIGTVPEAFLRLCSSLRRLDLSALANLETLPPAFLSKCTTLEEVLLPHSIISMCNGVLHRCSSLKR